MKIESVSHDFSPTNFEILDFYGEETCFLWENDQLGFFPYNTTSSTIKILPITAPRVIKSIHSCLGRVFLVCEPHGIYKFTKTHEFALLSASGLAIGTEYYEVLVVQDNCLILTNKRDKIVKELLVLSNLSLCDLDKESLFNFLLLSPDFTHENLKTALFIDKKSICLIANRRKLYKLTNESIQLVYENLHNITEIIPVKKDNLILGLILNTNYNQVVFVYVKKCQLAFKKIHFNTEIRTIAAGFLENSEDIIWIVYADKEKIYYAQQNINLDALHKICWQKESIICCKSYKEKIIGLTFGQELEEISFNMMHNDNGGHDLDVFQEVKPEMLTGSEVIVENICESAKELDNWNKKLAAKKEELHRINIYTHKQKIPCIPKINVDRNGKYVFLKVKFECNLPQGSYVTVSVRSKGQSTFSSKLVDGNETTLEVPLRPEFLDSSIDVNFDLITFAEENKPWCIVKDCLKEPGSKDKQKVRGVLNEKSNFLNTKLSALKYLIQQDGQIDVQKLVNIKKSLRRGIPDVV